MNKLLQKEGKVTKVPDFTYGEREKHLVLMNLWYPIANQKVPQIVLQRIAYIL